MLNTLQLPAEWSTLKKLIWLRGSPASGGTGTETLSLTAFAAPTKTTVTKKSKVTSCEVSFTPSQDLHGYANPWPAGGGVNICPPDIEQGAFDENGLNDADTQATHNTRVRTKDYIPVQADSTIVVSAEGVASYYSISGYTANDYETARIQSSSWTLLGTPVTINSGVAYIRIVFRKSANTALTPSEITKVQCEYGSSPTTYQPYSNLCPISGWQGAEVYIEPTYDPTATPKASVTFGVQSANQWDEETESGYISSSTGQPVPDSSKIRMKNYVPVLPETTYYKVTSVPFYNCYYDKDKNFLSYGDASQGTFTTPANCYYLRAGFESAYGTTYLHNISINYPSTVTTYNPYRNYILGGTAEIVAGTGSEKYAEVDLGSLTWTGASQNRFYATIDDALNSNENITDILCEAYTPKAVIAQNNCWLYQQKIYIVDANYSTSDAFATAVNGIKLTYPLATPTPFTFPPASDQLLLQKGDNYNWAEMTND